MSSSIFQRGRDRYSLHQIEKFDANRDFVQIALCRQPPNMPAGGRPFQFAMWGKEVPEVTPATERAKIGVDYS